MSEPQTPPVGPVPPVGGTPRVDPVRREAQPNVPSGGEGAAGKQNVAAITGGSLAGQYAQLVINPDTHDVVIRVRDAQTDRVLREYPSQEIEHLAMYMKQYAATLARRRAAQRSAKG
jgi:hypothetical protein